MDHLLLLLMFKESNPWNRTDQMKYLLLLQRIESKKEFMERGLKIRASSKLLSIRERLHFSPLKNQCLLIFQIKIEKLNKVLNFTLMDLNKSNKRKIPNLLILTSQTKKRSLKNSSQWEEKAYNLPMVKEVVGYLWVNNLLIKEIEDLLTISGRMASEITMLPIRESVRVLGEELLSLFPTIIIKLEEQENSILAEMVQQLEFLRPFLIRKVLLIV